MLGEIAQSSRATILKSGDTLRLGTEAMACRFEVILNPEDQDQLAGASSALDLVHELENQMSVYRDWSELSRLNRVAATQPVTVESRLFDLLLSARELCINTERCFDPTMGPLIALWRKRRHEGTIPSDSDIALALRQTGIQHVHFDPRQQSVRFAHEGIELNLGGIGKGYALDRAASMLDEQGAGDFLIHGGHSSLLARGSHSGEPGWPIGIRNPLFPKQRLAVLRIANGALSTSGSGVQSFRHNGKRYGHILDPRTGYPSEGMLSVTVIAPTAAQADALSTAFFVLGVEKAQAYCHNNRDVMALLIPPPEQGRKLDPINCGIPDDWLLYTHDDPS